MLVFYKYRKNAIISLIFKTRKRKSGIFYTNMQKLQFATKDRVHAHGAELLTQKVPQT